MKLRSAAVAAIIAMAVATPATAFDQRLSTKGVDWSNTAEVKAVYRKITRMAREMCASTNAPEDMVRRCVNQTVADAVSRSNKPELYAHHVSLQKQASLAED